MHARVRERIQQTFEACQWTLKYVSRVIVRKRISGRVQTHIRVIR